MLRKNIFHKAYLLSLLLLLFAAASCVEPLPQAGGLAVNLTLSTAPLSTKATVAGDDAYNENVITHVDWWLYGSGDTDAVSLGHGRIMSPAQNSAVSWSATANLSEYVEALGGEGATGRLLLVANLPDAAAAPSSGTRAAVLATAVSADFISGTQPSFVMTAAVEPSFTVAKGIVPVSVTMERLAAKLSLAVEIPVSITDGGNTYTPNVSPENPCLRAYFVSTNQSSRLDGSATGAPTASYGARAPQSVTGSGPWHEEGAPFYSYPNGWDEGAENEPYFKISMEWRREGAAASIRPYYYKVLMPSSMGYRIDANSLHRFVVTLGVLGGETEDEAVDVTPAWSVAAWKDGGTVGADGGSGSSLTRGNYLEIPRSEYQLYADHTITVPVTSSHDITVTVNSATYRDYSSATATTKTIAASKYSITTSGRSSFTLTHTLNDDISSTELDCSRVTFVLTVRNGAGLSQQVTIIQYPSLFITSEAPLTAPGKTRAGRGTVFLNGTSNDYSATSTTYFKMVYETGRSTSAYRLGTIRSYNYSNSTNNNFNIYTVNVTNLKGSGYYIGDPRSRTAVNYENLRGTSTSGAPLNGYRPVDPDASDVIAPSFLLSSSYGACYSTDNNYNGRITYEYANRRCAAYQENGYPAGRWRMPTDAEIRFCIGLSDNGKIPALFNGNYWAASGVIYNGSGNVVSGTTAAVRCVYDVWYWGERPENQSEWAAAGYNTAWIGAWSGWQN